MTTLETKMTIGHPRVTVVWLLSWLKSQ